MSERIARLKHEMNGRADLFKRLNKKFGQGVLDTVQESVVDQAREQLQQADLPNRDLDAVMEILWEPATDVLEFEVEERAPQLLKLKVTGCLFADEMRKLSAEDIGFAFYCAFDYGFCEGLNPDIKFTRTKTLMQGDDCCDHTYEL